MPGGFVFMETSMSKVRSPKLHPVGEQARVRFIRLMRMRGSTYPLDAFVLGGRYSVIVSQVTSRPEVVFALRVYDAIGSFVTLGWVTGDDITGYRLATAS
jgi:hypothetical protein